MKMDNYGPKSKAIILVFSSKIAPKSKSLFCSWEERLMKIDDFWPKSKAIVLVFSSKITPKSKSLFVSWEERVMKMDDFWPKSKVIVLVFSWKHAPKSKSLFCSWEERVMRMDDFWPKSKAIVLVFSSKITQNQNLSFAVEKKKWWKWIIMGQKVNDSHGIFMKNCAKIKISLLQLRRKNDENGWFLAKK